MNNSISKLPAVRAELLGEIHGLFGDGQEEAVRKEIRRCRRVALLRDLAAYIRIARRGGADNTVIAFNVAHDLFQWRDRTVYPRTAGYAKREKATVKEN